MALVDGLKLVVTPRHVVMKKVEDLQPGLMRVLVNEIEKTLRDFNGYDANVLFSEYLSQESLEKVVDLYREAGWEVKISMTSRSLNFK